MGFFEELRGHTIGLYESQIHKRKSGKIRLCMAMQVKDEIDIVELNIRYHAHHGCEAFFIVDNGSTDGTREKLEDLKKEFDITIVDDYGLDHNQSVNMTKLSHMAKKAGFDWVIENDADEFWYPLSGKLDSGLDRLSGSVRVERVNVLPIKGKSSDWINSPYHTFNTINYHKNATEQDKFNFLLTPVMHKVMVNPHGLINVGGGNHGARHVIDKLKRRRFTKWNDNIKIFHFALRSYEAFEKKVVNINKSLKYTEKNNYSKHNFGKNAVHWSKAYDNRVLKEVYEKMLLDEAHLDCYQKLGLVKIDSSFKESLNNLKNKL